MKPVTLALILMVYAMTAFAQPDPEKGKKTLQNVNTVMP
tara:strand:+ start:570 stop:686 length:117 start_codon:yes stop_codon:yes gene_type:complete